MQPHRVQRLVMDGVVDTGDYYRGERLLNVQDADAILQRVSEHCGMAGPERCPLHTQGGSENIMQRFYNILESLKGNPVGVPSSGLLAPDLVTYSDVKLALREPSMHHSNCSRPLWNISLNFRFPTAHPSPLRDNARRVLSSRHRNTAKSIPTPRNAKCPQKALARQGMGSYAQTATPHQG